MCQPSPVFLNYFIAVNGKEDTGTEQEKYFADVQNIILEMFLHPVKLSVSWVICLSIREGPPNVHKHSHLKSGAFVLHLLDKRFTVVYCLKLTLKDGFPWEIPISSIMLPLKPRSAATKSMTQFVVDLSGIFSNGSNVLLNFISFFPDEKPSGFLNVIKKFVSAFTNQSVYVFLLNSIQHMLFGWAETIMGRRRMA